MKILFAASEVFPFAKTGGLADVAGSLPVVLHELGHDVRVVMPKYRGVERAGAALSDTGVRIPVRIGDEIAVGALFEGRLAGRVPVYFVRYDPYFDRDGFYGTAQGDYPDNASRYIFFSRALLDTMPSLDFWPDVLHLNDWQSALAALYLKSYTGVARYDRVASLLTIHNLGYQGLFWHYDMPLTGLGWEYFTPEGIEFYGKINFLKAGLIAADLLSTVSRKYAREIQTEPYGFGLDGVLRKRARDLFGILNGVDYAHWDPAADPLLPERYGPGDLTGKAACKRQLLKRFGLPVRMRRPLIGCVSRLTAQKGFDLVAAVAPELARMDVALVVLGDGEQTIRHELTDQAERHPGHIGIRIAYDNSLAHLIEAGADFFLMPSRYEPCGLNQMYSLKYGTIPIVRGTGGLDDTIVSFNGKTGTGNGFKFFRYSPQRLLDAVRRALAVYDDRPRFKRLIRNAMSCDFSWMRSAQEYEKLYDRLLTRGAKRRQTR